jgi:2-keto-4-pentenoate hydratase
MSDIKENQSIEEVAKILREAADQKITCEPIRGIIGVTDITKAYKIQSINSKIRIANGARVVGSKIGLTSIAVQKQLGVDQPDYGLLYDDMEILNGGEVSCIELMQPKVEAEIAFVLKKDLNTTSITASEMMSAIDYAVASIEIVGSRIRDWNIKITDTIADNASASHFVIGHRPVSLENIDLINCKMVLYKNGEIVSEGTGAACLGSPINACIWLAKTMAAHGSPLKAGDLILSGALGPMSSVAPGDQIKTVIEGLGEVSVSFTA